MTNSVENTYPFVSIVIAMYNEEKHIADCIESLLSQDYPHEKYEIIVADGYSKDSSRDIVNHFSKDDPRVRLIDNPGRKAPSGFNHGIRASTGDVIIILGAHSYVKHDFIRKNIEAMKRDNVKCVGGKIINKGKTIFQSLVGVAMGTPFGMGSAPFRYSKTPKYVNTVAFAAYDRTLFDEVGLFDENGKISEDSEFNWRIRQKGHKILFDPDIVSFYYPRDSIKKIMQQFFRYGILRVNMFKKHLDAIGPLHMLAPALVMVLTLLLIAGIFIPSAFFVAAGIVAMHLLIGMVTGLTSSKNNRIKAMLLVPVIILVMHISWGTGIWYGFLKK